MFRIISVKLIFIFSFEKVHFSAVLCNFIWWQDCWLWAMHSMVKSTIFLVSHSETMQRFVSITFWWLDVDITLGSVNFFLVYFSRSLLSCGAVPVMPRPQPAWSGYWCTLQLRILHWEIYLTTWKNREHIETSLFCYANALHFLSVQLDSGQFQENSQEYVR